MSDKEPNFQMSFAFIDRQIEENHIQQRLLDGYVNATALCKAVNKRWTHYYESKAAKEFIKALSTKTDIPSSTLIQAVRGGNLELQGTWVHPYVAVNLAQWAG